MKDETLNTGMKRLAATSMLILALVAGASGCSAGGGSTASDSSTAVTLNPEAPRLKSSVDAFFKQVGADAIAHKAIPAKGAKGVTQKDFNDAFKASLGYIKPGAMTDMESRTMLVTFGELYAYDSTASVETDANDFVISGNEAHIKSGRLKVTTAGKLQPSYADSESATLYFESVKGVWMVSNFNISG